MCIGEEEYILAEMKNGELQSTILSPILFLIYTAELYWLLEGYGASCHCFADDTLIYFSFETVEIMKLNWFQFMVLHRLGRFRGNSN